MGFHCRVLCTIPPSSSVAPCWIWIWNTLPILLNLRNDITEILAFFQINKKWDCVMANYLVCSVITLAKLNFLVDQLHVVKYHKIYILDWTVFYVRPGQRGEGLVRPPLAVLPLFELELRGRNEHVGRCETQRLVHKFKVPDQPVTSEVRQRPRGRASKFGFWLIIPPKEAAEPKFKHHHNPLIKPRQLIYSLFGKGQSQCWPLGQGQVTPLRAWIELRV